MQDITYLSEDNIIYCYEEGIRVRLYHRLPTRGGDVTRIKSNLVKGDYDASENRIIVYLPHIIDFPDYAKTLFHEFAHALDDLLFDDNYPEEEIENIAVLTYTTNPLLFEFIKDMFKLPYTKFDNK